MNFLAKTDGKEIEYNSIQRKKDFLALLGACNIRIKIEKIASKRTPTQNNSIHLLFDQWAKLLREKGISAKMLFKERADVPVTAEMVKALWQEMQKQIVGHKFTARLKSSQVDMVFEPFNKYMGEKFGEHIPFPRRDSIPGYDY